MTLKTEINTPEMGERVTEAFEASGIAEGTIQSNFEHGQWWITVLESGAQWSVCDAEGGDAVDGFCFEQITEGEDEY